MPAPKEIKVMWTKYLPQTCGVGEIGYFRYHDDEEAFAFAPNIQNLKIDKDISGCGWIIVSFTMKKVYLDAYKQLVERFGEPIYESPVRVNKRTKRKFFFCIFDTQGKK